MSERGRDAAQDVLEQAAAWRDAGRRVALATVVRTWGSSPRPAGSHLAVAESGEFFGSVSGGCVEGAVVTEALALLASGSAKLLHFGVTDAMAWEVGLACGGKIDVHVEPLPETFDRLLADRRAGHAIVAATWLDSGRHALFDPRVGTAGEVPAEVREAARQALATDLCAVVETAEGAVFLEPHNPPLRLVVVGAVHLAQPLVRIATIAGFAVTVVDPRTAFDLALPDVARSTEWPAEALAALRPDHRTAVVTLTHDPKLDDPALVAALRSDAFYIGCLGSRKTHAARRERLAAQGFDDAALARLNGPIGLAIGARTPEEIAIAILAQTIAAKNPNS
ncbi:MAG TPA: XdhC family protein [Thermoanaerobaculia bacterium]